MLLYQNFLNRSSIKFYMVDFKWQLIFTVLAFITSIIVSFGHVLKFVHQQKQFWVIMFTKLIQLENQSFIKIWH